MTRIVWVEDQSHWVERFKPTLEATDFNGSPTDVTVFKFAEAACQYIKQCPDDDAPDVALLDAHMGGNSHAGLTVSRALQRRWPDLPVVYLSEHSGTDIEQAAFEQNGTLDFIAKHQRNVEAVLCWRIQAVLRQQRHQPGDMAKTDSDTLRSGSLSIDTRTWEVFWQGHKLMNPSNSRRPLAPTPRKILRFLVEAAPSPLSTWQIADKLDADPERFSYANYRQHIRTLRRAFDQVETGDGGFTDRCREGVGIVTFGDQEAYCWRPDHDPAR
ncbi:response regulator transcription factor [Saccharospirillum sp.]|uniref:response regulator transcription factor n=1 Tax=Saccharospirillum sp. TaxID=2033801 RepID=UPI0034A0A211